MKNQSFDNRHPAVSEKWGLVIQGPRYSTGKKGLNGSVADSPIVNEKGYDTLEAIKSNLKHARATFSSAVISGWTGDSFDLPEIYTDWCDHVSTAPPMLDWDNRRKQIISTISGVESLQDRGATHVLKVRTDQILPEEFFTWLTSSWVQSSEKHKILASDALHDEIFYVGDFIWAGEISTILGFLNAISAFGPHQLHPVTCVDSTLKYLSRRPDFPEVFSPEIKIDWQLCDPRNRTAVEYWHKVFHEEFSTIPHEFFRNIIWRGMKLTEIFDVTSFEATATTGLSDETMKIGFKKVIQAICKLFRQRRRLNRTTPPNRWWVKFLSRILGKYRLQYSRE